MKRMVRIAARAAGLVLMLGAGYALAQGPGPGKDVFQGKLFPPNVILEHQDAIGLDREQYTAIRQAVVEAQGDIAEHEWDLRTAYQNVLEELDKVPADRDRVIDLVDAALLAENEVKKRQVAMLVTLRNLLTEEQVGQLKSLTGRGAD